MSLPQVLRLNKTLCAKYLPDDATRPYRSFVVFVAINGIGSARLAQTSKRLCWEIRARSRLDHGEANMREKMGRMQSQIAEFVSTLNREFAARPQVQPERTSRNWLVPVITVRGPGRKPRT
jgi:hypothetical protein